MRFTRPCRQCVTSMATVCSPLASFLPCQSSTTSSPFPLYLELLSHALPPSICIHPSFCHCSIIFSMEGTGRKRPRYSCPDLKDDVVEELIDRCDVITSASMVGSFKTILDSTNNIITRNPRVQERFDPPYLLRRNLLTGIRTTEASPYAS